MLSTSDHQPVAPRSGGASIRSTDVFRDDMLVWAEPVIADCIASAYDECGLGGSYHSLLTTHHRRLWRALILEHRQHVEAVRNDLVRDAFRAGLDLATIEDIDHSVLEELMDIVLKRFRASRDAAKGFGLVLLAAATNLGAGRPLAA